MEFIIENYIWFIIGGIVILMTIIGYIADKTNFTKKEENKEKIKHSKKNKVEKIEELPKQEPVKETSEIDLMEDFNMDTEPAFETDEPKVDDEILNNVVESSQELDEVVESTKEEPVELEKTEINDEAEEVLSETLEKIDEEPKEDIIEEDLYVGLDGTPNAYKETLEEDSENLEIELPSISSLDSELREETDEDDVWKF